MLRLVQQVGRTDESSLEMATVKMVEPDHIRRISPIGMLLSERHAPEITQGTAVYAWCGDQLARASTPVDHWVRLLPRASAIIVARAWTLGATRSRFFPKLNLQRTQELPHLFHVIPLRLVPRVWPMQADALPFQFERPS
jgi:hypothetical protein